MIVFDISFNSLDQVLSYFIVNFLFKCIFKLNENDENAYANKTYAGVSSSKDR